MPFSPSDFACWGWLLCGVMALLIAQIFWPLLDKRSSILLAIGVVGYIMFRLAAVFCEIIGIILFVKWVWGG